MPRRWPVELRYLWLADDELRRRFDELGFVTGSNALTTILREAYKAACVSDITVLLEGETGTGKQVLAFAIHRLDQKRSAFPFVTVHCGSLSETLAESELFGHQKGAFTGAVANRKGLFQSAHRGTLFLDDVNDLPRQLQAKLLDVVQRGAVRPMGSDEERQVDVRILAASNQPLKPLVLQNRFRADLYHRLNVVKLCLPPLRERMQDLPNLVLALAHRHHEIYGPIEVVENELLSLLYLQPFSGNVRELENDVQRMLFSKTAGTSLGLTDWRGPSAEAEAEESPDLLGKAAANIWQAISLHGVSYVQAIHHIESRVLQAALKVEGRTRRQVAQCLQTSERTLYHKIRIHRLRNQQ
jgi:transcriptional regulator with PAS, ATPase and Fis domain